MNESHVLSLQNVSLTLGQGAARNTALIDISLDLAAGELVAITGRSGSGKSSLLNVAGGLIPPSAGSVSLAGVEVGGMSQSELAAVRRRSVGFVFQELNLIESLTAEENVSLPLELSGVRSSEAMKLAEEKLDTVGIADLAKRFPDEMSGGQRQRVAIARSLVGNRNILMADEPTGALDEVTGEAIMRVLRSECDAGAAVLLVTHDSTLAAWADRVIRLRDGRIESATNRTSAGAAGR